jgi:hypothetical protein
MAQKCRFSQEKVRFDDFPEFLSDIQGVFRIRQDPFSSSDSDSSSSGSGTGSAGSQRQVLQQLTTEPRDMSYGNGHGQLPMSLLGSKNWSDYQVTAVGRINATSAAAAAAAAAAANETVAVYGRCGHGFAFAPAGGYVLQIWPASGKWTLATGTTHEKILSHGTSGSSLPMAGWIELSLSMVGTSIRASIGGKVVAAVSDATFSQGMAGLGSGWHPSWFQRFAVAPPS